MESNRFGIFIDGIWKSLFVGGRVSTLLIDSREIWCVFPVEIGGFTKQFDGLVPLLILGGLRAFSGKLVCFLGIFADLCQGHLRITKPQSHDESKGKIFFHDFCWTLLFLDNSKFRPRTFGRKRNSFKSVAERAPVQCRSLARAPMAQIRLIRAHPPV